MQEVKVVIILIDNSSKARKSGTGPLSSLKILKVS